MKLYKVQRKDPETGLWIDYHTSPYEDVALELYTGLSVRSGKRLIEQVTIEKLVLSA